MSNQHNSQWVIVARFDSDPGNLYDIAYIGFLSLYANRITEVEGDFKTGLTFKVLMSQHEYDRQSESIKALNEPVKKDSLTDKINQAIKTITDKILMEDTLNKLELVSSLLDDLVGMDTLGDYPAIESLIVDLYNALLDSDSPLNR
jgi:hypothetical protein